MIYVLQWRDSINSNVLQDPVKTRVAPAFTPVLVNPPDKVHKLTPRSPSDTQKAWHKNKKKKYAQFGSDIFNFLKWQQVFFLKNINWRLHLLIFVRLYVCCV